MSTRDLKGTFWFCVDHHIVEQFPGCGSKNRIGPFDSEAAASNALKTIADREKKYDAEDASWNEGV